VGDQGCKRGLGKTRLHLSLVLAKNIKEMVRQIGDILFARSQRRNGEGKHVEPVKQIGAEQALLGQRL